MLALAHSAAMLDIDGYVVRVEADSDACANTIHAVNGASASAGNFGTGSGIWFLLSTRVALFAGGRVARHLAGMPRLIDGTLHGITAWSLTSLVTVWLL